MSDEESLFGDLGLASMVRKTGRDVTQECVDEAWSLWEERTERPKSKYPETRFAKTYRELLGLKYTHERLIRCVAAAAHLPPRPRDPMDTRRAIMVLSNTKLEAEALSLLDQGDASIFKWVWKDELKLIGSTKTVAEVCGVPFADWSAQDHEYAGILVSSIDEERLRFAATRTRLHLGEDYVFPSEIVRYSAIWRNETVKVSVKTNAKRDTYHAGKQESETLEGLELNADLLSEKLLIRGCPAHLVREFYLLAPDGYWNIVLDEMEKDITQPLHQIYDNMAEQFDFHPSKRELPQW